MSVAHTVLASTNTGLAHFTQAPEPKKIHWLIEKGLHFKNHPLAQSHLGQGKTLALIFFNPSLRTRLSSHKAAMHLGLTVMSLNANEGWQLEFEEEVIMNSDRAEHVKEAAQVISQYADIIGIRSFPTLTNQEKDYADQVLNKFTQYASVPIISLESAIRHPLQSLADLMTINTFKTTPNPKIVLTWAPHPKALPQAVANSFAEWVLASGAELTIANPSGYDLAPEFRQGAIQCHDQAQAFADADFVYAKNWSSFEYYGQNLPVEQDWQITPEKMAWTNDAYFMHCLPVRRNVVVADAVLDSSKSLVIEQANHRTFAMQAVLHEILQHV